MICLYCLAVYWTMRAHLIGDMVVALPCEPRVPKNKSKAWRKPDQFACQNEYCPADSKQNGRAQIFKIFLYAKNTNLETKI